MSRVIVISAENTIPRESGEVNGLFEGGLVMFHLRKPHWSASQQRQFLIEIEPEWRSRISIHQHHEMAAEFGIRFIHFRESERKKGLMSGALALSTSFHSTEELTGTQGLHHAFLGPVADSISKPGYLAKNFVIPQPLPFRLYAIGGITPSNAARFIRQGFYGVAALGAIWSNRDTPLSNLERLTEQCSVPA